jgi:hypothetical protein
MDGTGVRGARREVTEDERSRIVYRCVAQFAVDWRTERVRRTDGIVN